jgi:hypothetical protein
MTLSNRKECVNVNELIESVKIKFICPKCSASKQLEFPKSVVDKAKNLTTISIPKYLICEHSFQAFIDKNYKIRGYQSVDFEFNNTKEGIDDPIHQKKLTKKRKSDKILFETLITEGNYVEYLPKDYKMPKKKETTSQKEIIPRKKENFGQSESKERNLKEIYEDFWEYIEDDNEIFREFIIKDDRRKDNDIFEIFEKNLLNRINGAKRGNFRNPFKANSL